MGDQQESEKRTPLRRWQHVIAAVAALAAVTIAVTAIVNTTSSGQATGTRGSSASTAASTSASAPAPTPVSVVPGAVGSTLGREIKPLATDPCRSERVAEGSAWQFAPVKLNADAPVDGYFCNLFAGGTGSIDFVLGKGFASFSVDVGFVVDSPSATHIVRFEVIGDETTYLAAPVEVRYGTTIPVRVDVSSVTRLRLKVTEVGQSTSSDAPSKPTWARPEVRKTP